MNITTKQENVLLVIHWNADPSGAHGTTLNGKRYVVQAWIASDLLRLEPDIGGYDRARNVTRKRLAKLESEGLVKRPFFGAQVWTVTPRGYEALDAAREVTA